MFVTNVFNSTEGKIYRYGAVNTPLIYGGLGIKPIINEKEL